MEAVHPVPSYRFEQLDALRGLCALAVVGFHTSFLTGVRFAPSGYLAVDVFFVISGFVIAHAYGDRLQRGHYFTTYLIKRYARFLPMWWIGVAIGMTAAFPGVYHDRAWSGFAISSALALVILPNPGEHVLFPLNLPGWSLFVELTVNIGYAALLPRLSRRVLVGTIATSFLYIVLATLRHGNMSSGFTWDTADAGMARGVYGFAVGVLIHRLGLHRKPRFLSGRWALAALGGVVILLFADVVGGVRPWFDLACAGVVIPVTIAGLVGTGCSWRGCETLGAISYPIYAIHFGVFLLAKTFVGLASGWQQSYLSGSAALLVGLSVVSMGFVLGKFVDPQCQRIIGRYARIRAVAVAKA
ncbi:peptidoglycan/LPS O-acetylase OafA/YrhL [Sphingomonas jinjuensis]|uniref:Peptidoglycan/LPS O-acetylase OafA/YrhL n=1 Tax=Sphingomonas jinjuensis TaxID=535907 RepID=A0A840FK44_9SPHN|nr:acyltransferase [Sphingomonas jinjuensis]MBB4153685.1 peptidoglycan/LPS O-acetylase OafA/YrhL [Sphingomonas jinjuensis]